MSSAPHPSEQPRPEVIEAAAAAWLSLRDRGMSSEETADFVRWLQQDPQHATIFAELDAVWRDFDRLGAVPANASGTCVPDGDLLAPRIRSRSHRSWMWGLMGVAAVAAIALLAIINLRAPHQTFATAIGAFQKLDLPDGSVAQLNTDTSIEMVFTADERRVRIVRGEVFFAVAKDPSRPFVVTAGPVAVRAVGTAFNVRHDATAVEVLVTEGRVRVDDAVQGRSLLAPLDATEEPALLVAGERAVVAVPASVSRGAPALATVVKVTTPAVQRALAWQERRLEFDAVPLADVVREFNRYNHRQLVVPEAALAAKRFSGSFRADGYESLVRLLEENFGVSATRSEREIVLRASR